MRRATDRVSSRRLDRGTLLRARPKATASAPVSLRARYSSSNVRAVPIRRGSRCVPPPPGTSPCVSSGSPRMASSATMRRSHASAISRPPPRAAPFTEAIVGKGRAASAVDVPVALETGTAFLRRLCPTGLLEVHARAEMTVASSRQDEHPHLRRTGQELVDLPQLVAHLLVARIGDLGPVQCEPRDAVPVDVETGSHQVGQILACATHGALSRLPSAS